MDLSICILQITVVNMQGGAPSPLYIFLIIPGIINYEKKKIKKKNNYNYLQGQLASYCTICPFPPVKFTVLFHIESNPRRSDSQSFIPGTYSNYLYSNEHLLLSRTK